MKDCENCRKQPSCQRYGAAGGCVPLLSRELGIKGAIARMGQLASADCRHFEEIEIEQKVGNMFVCGCGREYVFATGVGETEVGKVVYNDEVKTKSYKCACGCGLTISEHAKKLIAEHGHKINDDHRERGCSNCKWFNGFASYAIWGETIRHLWEIVNCKHSEDDGVRTVCPDGGCEHHEFRDDGAIL